MTNSTPPLEDTGSFRQSRQPMTFSRVLESIILVGRDLLSRTQQSVRSDEEPAAALGKRCHQLLDHRGEASGLALASEILTRYESLSPDQRLTFLLFLSQQFGPDLHTINRAAEAYRENPVFETYTELTKAIEPPRQRLLRRINMVPGGTAALVKMRGHVLELLERQPELRALESDLRTLLISWFNRGFLVMDQIDWNSPASVLEKIVTYEAVHEINALEDLRTRVAEDRRLFAFFHPAMPDDPIIFVQIALTKGLVGAVEPLLANDRVVTDVRDADTALFYSISNCHAGLRGVSFGNFLIKQVIEELRRDLENIKHFVTLSPVPGFRSWLDEVALDTLPENLLNLDTVAEETRSILLRLCAHYLLHEKTNGEPLDPVARFHLGNGALLERINWKADRSPSGLRRSAGIMVNYAYRLKDIEKNHERYFADGEVVASSEVRKLAQSR